MSFAPSGSILLAIVLGAFCWCLVDTIRDAESASVEATYYGSAHEGLPTASGEPFRSQGYTAAHPTAPFGTRLMVCKDSCTSVRVNDRPDNKTQLDLSEAAAESIGLKDEGRGRVEVQQTTSQPSNQLPKTGGSKK